MKSFSLTLVVVAWLIGVDVSISADDLAAIAVYSAGLDYDNKILSPFSTS